MTNRFLSVLLSVLVLLCVIARAQDDDDDQARPPHAPVMKPTDQPSAASFACPYEKGFQKLHKMGAYTVRVLPTVQDPKDKDDKDQDADPRCRVVLTSAAGKRMTIAYEWALSLDPISGKDLNGDGIPDLVLAGYSGGLHCCYVYEIVSLERRPRVLHTFQNLAPMKFERQADGSTLIHAVDGVFDYFIVPHSDAVIPQVVLKLKGNDLVDVSADYPELYDREIEQVRNELAADEIAKLRNANFHNKLYTDHVPAAHKVLTIVLDYVYSEREEEAWRALDEMWPAGDVSRIKSLILERRKRGMLANLGCDCRPAMIARRAAHVKRKPSPPDESTDPRVRDIIDD